MGSATRAPVATSAIIDIVAPTATASTVRATGHTDALCSPMRAGMRRSTRAKVTRVTVSTRIWVSARSGAPLVANSATMPSPVAETSTTPVYRFCARTATMPAMIMMGATTSCMGVCQASNESRHSGLASSAVPSAATKTTKIVPT